MFCRKCGQEIRQGAKFCVKCGTPVSAQQPTQTKKTQTPLPTAAGSNKAKKEKKSTGGKGIIIGLICGIVVALAVIVGLLIFYQTSVKEASEEKDTKIEDEWDEEDRNSKNGTEAVILENDTEKTDAEDTKAADTEMAASEAEEVAVAEEAQEENIHEYRIVVKDVSWTEAYQEAKRVPNGYLVNIDTEEEWNTILQQIQSEQREKCIFWIGAIRRGNSQDYFWVDAEGNSVGESLNQSTNWLTGEPTYYDSENDMEERYVDMFYSSGENRWVWNDTPDDLISLLSYYSGKVAYIIEIENE